MPIAIFAGINSIPIPVYHTFKVSAIFDLTTTIEVSVDTAFALIVAVD